MSLKFAVDSPWNRFDFRQKSRLMKKARIRLIYYVPGFRGNRDVWGKLKRRAKLQRNGNLLVSDIKL